MTTDHAALKAAAQAATQGEWRDLGSADPEDIALAVREFARSIGGMVVTIQVGPRIIAYLGATEATLSEDAANAAYIIAACNAVPALLEERERLAERVRELEAWAACDGCGSTQSVADLRAAGHVSCCPERKMLTASEWRARATAAETERDRMKAALVAAEAWFVKADPAPADMAAGDAACAWLNDHGWEEAVAVVATISAALTPKQEKPDGE
ncbi:MAG: ead/Ea22-like family protein [Phycisphaerae bacterium]|jgi:hypothetical protein